MHSVHWRTNAGGKQSQSTNEFDLISHASRSLSKGSLNAFDKAALELLLARNNIHSPNEQPLRDARHDDLAAIHFKSLVTQSNHDARAPRCNRRATRPAASSAAGRTRGQRVARCSGHRSKRNEAAMMRRLCPTRACTRANARRAQESRASQGPRHRQSSTFHKAGMEQ